ncbi:MAG: NYN domain-containing protein [Bacteroidota bacterium]
MEGQNVAIYLDFENLAISAETVYPSRNKPLAIEPLVDFAASKGNVCLKKAYADWSKETFAKYQGRLMEQGFELIHLPGTNAQGKNGADVRLAVDVMEYIEFFPGIDSIVIGSGDTDFIPLIQRLRARGKEVIVMGFEHSVGTLVKRNSVEFKSLEKLIGTPEEESPTRDLAAEIDPTKGRDLMMRFIRAYSDEEPILMSQLKQRLLRLDSTFSEKELGFTSFKDFIQSLVGDLVLRIDHRQDTLPVVYLNPQAPGLHEASHAAPPDPQHHAVQFLSKKLRYQNDAPRRMAMSHALYQSFQETEPLSMNEMFDHIYSYMEGAVPKTDIKKFINTLFTGGAFKPYGKKGSGPLLSRPFRLDESIESVEGLDQIYIRRVSEILQSRYTELESHEILELLI